MEHKEAKFIQDNASPSSIKDEIYNTHCSIVDAALILRPVLSAALGINTAQHSD